MLIRRGLDVADRYGLRTLVMSEQASLKLYLNLGFELVETVSTDYAQFGGTEPVVHYFMVRDVCGGRSGQENAVKSCTGCNGTGIKNVSRQTDVMIQRYKTVCMDCYGDGKTVPDRD